MENTLPPGSNPIEKPQGDSAEVISLKSVIEKSKAEITESLDQPPKRGRGRPRKIRPETAAPSMVPSGPDGQAASMQAPPMDLTPMFKTAVKLPFDIAAAQLNFAEFAISEEESEGPAILANQLLNAYLPDLQNADPKKVLLLSFAASMFMLAAGKMSLYQAKRLEAEAQFKSAATAENANSENFVDRIEAQPPAKAGSPTGYGPDAQTVPAFNAFRRGPSGVAFAPAQV